MQQVSAKEQKSLDVNSSQNPIPKNTKNQPDERRQGLNQPRPMNTADMRRIEERVYEGLIGVHGEDAGDNRIAPGKRTYNSRIGEPGNCTLPLNLKYTKSYH